MHYLVDGHNLIGSSHSIRLDDPHDEARLLRALHRWVLRNARHRVTVVFDHGVYGMAAPSYERVEAIWARSPQDADSRLGQLIERADPKQTRVVTSDRAVSGAARARGIEVLPARTFAAGLESPSRASHGGVRRRGLRPEPKLPRADVDRWLLEFGEES